MATTKYKNIISYEIKKNNTHLKDDFINNGFKLFWLTDNI